MKYTFSLNIKPQLKIDMSIYNNIIRWEGDECYNFVGVGVSLYFTPKNKKTKVLRSFFRLILL